MSVRQIGDNTIVPQTNETTSLPNKLFIGNSALLNNADQNGVRFLTAQFVGNQAQQDTLQQQAQQLIEKHTSKGWFGLSWLDNDALGRELAATIGTRPELAKVVFERMGKTEIYTAQAMIDAAGDEQLTKAAQSEVGKHLLSQAKQAFADNIAYQKSWGEFFSSKEKVAADEQRLQRIDRAFTEAAKTGQTQEVQETQSNGDYNVVTEEQVKAIMLPAASKPKKPKLEKNIADYTQRLNDTMKKFGINTPLKQAIFLATMRHESIGLSTMTELPSAHGSSKLKSKGRGIIQLTLDSNYKAASEFFEWGKVTVQKDRNGNDKKVFTSWDLLDKPELAAQPDYAFPIAGWYWDANKINSVVGNALRTDLLDIRQASAIVNAGRKNGDVLGVSDRLTGYKAALETLGVLVNDELRQNLDLAIKQNQGKERLRGSQPIFVK
jgi:predicted chitinase